MPKAAPPKLKTKHKGGRPSKKTPATLERALAAAREGLPSRFCAGLAGISYQSLNEYRKADPDFAQRYETALSEGVQAKFRKILEAGNRDAPGSWQALAWALERGYCAEFSRPEIQLHQINNSSTTVNNSLVISFEQAEGLQKRAKVIDAEIDKSTEAFLGRRQLDAKSMGPMGPGGPPREIEGELISSATITLPPPISRHCNWWRELSRGDGHRSIDPAAAEFIVRTICVDALGGAKAASLKVDMDAGALELRDVWDVLESLCGPSGWQALARRGEA